MDAAMHASDLVSEEEDALMLAEQARQRNAAKKARQKLRKQVMTPLASWVSLAAGRQIFLCHR